MSPCRRVSAVLRSGKSLGREAEQHLFRCARCRRIARAERSARELESLARPPAADAAVPPDFVARVMRGIPRPGRRPRFAPVWKWAAALAMFSAAAGYGYTVWTEANSAGQEMAVSPPAPTEESAALSF